MKLFAVPLIAAALALSTIPAEAMPTTVSVGRYPQWSGSLWGIAHHYHIAPAQLEKWNPELERGKHHWRLVFKGERVYLYNRCPGGSILHCPHDQPPMPHDSPPVISHG